MRTSYWLFFQAKRRLVSNNELARGNRCRSNEDVCPRRRQRIAGRADISVQTNYGPPRHACARCKRAGYCKLPKQIDLYKDGGAIWFEHNTRQYVDVVALKLSHNDFGEFANVAINEVEQTPSLPISAGMDCFVLGYPEGMRGPGLTPIWKRGSVASEPVYGYDKKPAFLVDTATRKGMSGAPVVARHSGLLKQTPGTGLGADDLIGTMTKFCGVYSGRIGDDLMGVQLGVVWKSDVLDDILSLKTPGINPLRGAI
jgi:hypothetical protein